MTFIHSPGSGYTIHTEVYEGPLDLLLNLITKAELDITHLSLAKVTDQYLAHLEKIQHNTALEVSGFLVVAAKLIQIKSEALLPRPPNRLEGEEDPAEALSRQLKQYKVIKQAAKWLKSVEDQGHHTYIRLAPPPTIEEDIDLEGVDLNTLIQLLKALYHYEEDAVPITSVVTIPRLTIKNKIHNIIQKLNKTEQLSYHQLLPNTYDRIEAIILFLAILELIKQHYVLADQITLFSDIIISATEKTFDNGEFKLALDE